MAYLVHIFKAWRVLLHGPISAKISAIVANQMRVFFSTMASQPINASCDSHGIVTLSCTWTELMFFVLFFIFFLKEENP